MGIFDLLKPKSDCASQPLVAPTGEPPSTEQSPSQSQQGQSASTDDPEPSSARRPRLPEQLPVRAYVTKLTFSDDTTMELAKSDIVVLVGPNNAGKSATLAEIERLAHNLKDRGTVLSGAALQTEGEGPDLVRWLVENTWHTEEPDASRRFRRFGVDTYDSLVLSAWEKAPRSGLGYAAGFLFKRLHARHRPYEVQAPRAIRLLHDPLAHPIHALQANSTIEAKVSEYVREGFGMGVAVHRNAGAEVPLLCGNIPRPASDEDRLSPSYLERLDKVPRIEEQGDGVRSFVGLLLQALVVPYSCLLIDEPEAFLHPPQARLAGQLLAREIPTDCQCFIATHSGDVVKGLLAGAGERIRVIRIVRDGNVNRVRELRGNDVARLWSDPLIRYSNVLDGLFHQAAFACESEADCRFYGSMLDATTSADGDSRAGGFMFTSSSGKDRLHIVASALRNVGVPLGVVADFDLIRDGATFQRLIEACGMNWADLQGDWKLVRKSIEECKPPLDSATVKKEIGEILGRVSSSSLPEKDAEDIRDVLFRASSWRYVKRTGMAILPSGDAYEACRRLLDKCGSHGIFILENGELERFCSSVGGHGLAWVNQVLLRDLGRDQELEAARKFVDQLRSWAIRAGGSIP